MLVCLSVRSSPFLICAFIYNLAQSPTRHIYIYRNLRGDHAGENIPTRNAVIGFQLDLFQSAEKAVKILPQNSGSDEIEKIEGRGRRRCGSLRNDKRRRRRRLRRDGVGGGLGIRGGSGRGGGRGGGGGGGGNVVAGGGDLLIADFIGSIPHRLVHFFHLDGVGLVRRFASVSYGCRWRFSRALGWFRRVYLTRVGRDRF